MVYAMSDMNNIYQFQDGWRIFRRVRAWTDKQANQIQKYFSTLLESVKKEKRDLCEEAEE